MCSSYMSIDVCYCVYICVCVCVCVYVYMPVLLCVIIIYKIVHARAHEHACARCDNRAKSLPTGDIQAREHPNASKQ